MMTRLLFVVCITLSICGSSTAGFYLTGAQLYRSDADGSNFVDAFGNHSDYRWTTNSGGTGGANLNVTPGRVAPSGSISFALITGIYNFEFEANGFSINVQNLGMNLFFTDTDGVADNSYNPSAAGQYQGDLTVTTQANSSLESFQFVDANLPVMNYLYQGNSFPLANGLKSFTVADQIVTVTGFQYSLLSDGSGGFKPKGSLRLSVTATPEPSTIGIGALAFCGVIHWVKKRRKGKAFGKTTVT